MIGLFVKSVFSSAYNKWQSSKKNAEALQKKTLFNQIQQAKNTFFGKKHHFNRINNYQDFASQVPICTYETIEPLIYRQRKGESNVLWPGKIRWYAKSSGTTKDRSKYIPVSKEMIKGNHTKAGRLVYASFLNERPRSKFLDINAKSLMLGGNIYPNPLDKKTAIGDVSSILLSNLPWWARHFITPNNKLLLYPDYQKKIKLLAEKTSKQNIKTISGVPSWIKVLCQEVIKRENKPLMEIWPNLELLVHGGVSFSPYKNIYNQLMPENKVYRKEVYNATEGIFGFQESQNDKDLHFFFDHGIFYELIPIELGKELDCTKAIPVYQGVLNKNYALCITTLSGLWRYLIGDTLKLTALNPLKFKLLGRTEHYINLFGEELMIHNVESALETTLPLHKAKIRDYSVCPIFAPEDKSNGFHLWMVDFETPPESMKQFAIDLDLCLQANNSDYEAKRTGDLLLSNLKIKTLPPLIFEDYLKKKKKIGAQSKIPRLLNKTDLAKEIYALSQTVFPY